MWLESFDLRRTPSLLGLGLCLMGTGFQTRGSHPGALALPEIRQFLEKVRVASAGGWGWAWSRGALVWVPAMEAFHIPQRTGQPHDEDVSSVQCLVLEREI